MNWETRTEVYALPFVKQIASGKLLHRAGNSAWCSVVTQGFGMGGGRIEVQGREDLWIHIDDALCCAAKTNTKHNKATTLLLLCSHQVMSNSFVTPQTASHQSLLFMGSRRQEYWSGLLLPSKDLPDPGIKTVSPALHANSLSLSQKENKK